ncbi:MAG: UvrD-helicase domain-containing protein [Nanoarchaeota archaeon]
MSKEINQVKLNKEQLEVINFASRNLLIIASAGTGKTTTIVERYTNLVQNQIIN